MVGEDLDRVSSSFNIDAPLPEALDDCEEFLIVDGVVELGSGELAGVETDGVEDAGSGRLGEDAAQGEVRRVCFDGEGELGLKMLEDGS